MIDQRTVHRDELVANARTQISVGLTQGEVVNFLRRAGLNKIDSIVALHELYGMDLDDAKRLVHESAAWRDRKAADEKLHDELILAADRFSDEQPRLAG